MLLKEAKEILKTLGYKVLKEDSYMDSMDEELDDIILMNKMKTVLKYIGSEIERKYAGITCDIQEIDDSYRLCATLSTIYDFIIDCEIENSATNTCLYSFGLKNKKTDSYKHLGILDNKEIKDAWGDMYLTACNMTLNRHKQKDFEQKHPILHKIKSKLGMNYDEASQQKYNSIIKEDTDDWDEADLGINSYADEKERKKIMKIHNNGKHYNNHYSWHYRNFHTKVNHASYAGGRAAEDKLLEAMKKEFTVQINKRRESGVKGRLSYNGAVLKFELDSNYKFNSPYYKNKNEFKTDSNIVSVNLRELCINETFDVNVENPEEIENLFDEIKAICDGIVDDGDEALK